MREALDWFSNYLIVIFPKSKPVGLVASFNISAMFRQFTHDLLCSLQTGVTALAVETIEIDQYFAEDDWVQAEKIKSFLSDRDGFLPVASKPNDAVAVKENGLIVVKRLITKHKNAITCEQFKFMIEEESDGARLFAIVADGKREDEYCSLAPFSSLSCNFH